MAHLGVPGAGPPTSSGGPSSATGGAPEPSSYLSVQEREGYWVVSMHKEPVNSLNLLMWQQLEAVLDRAEAAFPRVRGLIFTTGLKRDVFTAGNDLLELYAPRTSAKRYAEFWCTSNRVLCKLHRGPLSTIAAVRGACPAGGCMMALCCDHRVMSSQGAIGLNEVQLGILVPKFWALLMSQLVGRKAADKLLTTGKMVNPAEVRPPLHVSVCWICVCLGASAELEPSCRPVHQMPHGAFFV